MALRNMFDICQEVLFQLIEFLSRQREAYATIMPSFTKLCTTLHLQPNVLPPTFASPGDSHMQDCDAVPCLIRRWPSSSLGLLSVPRPLPLP